MTVLQKRALLIVITGTLSVVGYLILLVVFAKPAAALSAFGLMGFCGIAPLIGKGEKLDERDKSISKHAALSGFAMSYLVFIAGNMCVWLKVFSFENLESVSVHVLPMIVLIGGVVMYLTWGVVVLVLYGRHVEAEHV